MTREKSEIIYGLHAVRHALQHSPVYVLEIWIQNDKQSVRGIQDIIKHAGTIPVQYVSRQAMDKLTQYARHQGVIVRKKKVQSANINLTSLLVMEDDTTPLYLVLDGVQDPHNLGACIRTADAAGVKAVIIPKDRAVTLNATVRKVASGAAENVPVVEVTNLARSLRELQDAGIWIIGTAIDAGASIYNVDLNRPLALVMGSEEKGLRQNTRNHCDMLVTIPMAGVVENLNVSVATGICLYEAIRQRICVKRET
ncbi:MAG: 23S rRNA (guanosine(2251)-2'-O)-methyltransferase RlmB, partial [Gammaproteobacteria bacterium]|nr:23S rRNA (guanosine(2251)-2'-O)-methyltransferase RlmB [Gammaproteobacteria bacterium]